jgi:DNA-binding transcriptional regulator GbsR (MarR family)
MPGGRLTQQDRQRIAAGLAEGLGYAEIARRLARPTSTVSREVTRNGGLGSYRADQAHDATAGRARRSRSTPPPEPVRVADAVRLFEERFADLLCQMGVPRMAARVLTCLYTTDSGSLTAAELVQRLRVSPASISKAVAYLVGLELVGRERDPGHRYERYAIGDDVWARAWSASARKNATWADIAQRGTEIFDPATPAGARLAQMTQFLTQLSDDMTGGLPADAAGDVLTVLAALVHAARPLTADEMAAALGWPADRVAGALRDAERHSVVADPIVVSATGNDRYTVVARPDRLTPAQRAALSAGADQVAARLR